jgi:hypothetical protein
LGLFHTIAVSPSCTRFQIDSDAAESCLKREGMFLERKDENRLVRSRTPSKVRAKVTQTENPPIS